MRAALYASKVVAYAQGFDAIVAGAKEYGWDIDLGAIAKIWRGGCIIRAQFLNRIVDAYDARARPRRRCWTTPTSPTRSRRRGRVAARRRDRGAVRRSRARVLLGARYYDSLASERLPAALIQGQRDFFGAHTYKRVDKDGIFHTLWSGDRSEIPTTPSTH